MSYNSLESINGDRFLSHYQEYTQNIMYPTLNNPAGEYIYWLMGVVFDGLDTEMNNFVQDMSPLTCDVSYLDYYAKLVGVIRDPSWTDEQYRIIISWESYNHNTIAGIEYILNKLIIDNFDFSSGDKLFDVEYISSASFRLSNQETTLSLMSDKDNMLDPMGTTTHTVKVYVNQLIDISILQFLIDYYGYDWEIITPDPEPVIETIYLTDDMLGNLTLVPYNIYDVTQLTNNREYNLTTNAINIHISTGNIIQKSQVTGSDSNKIYYQSNDNNVVSFSVAQEIVVDFTRVPLFTEFTTTIDSSGLIGSSTLGTIDGLTCVMGVFGSWNQGYWINNGERIMLSNTGEFIQYDYYTSVAQQTRHGFSQGTDATNQPLLDIVSDVGCPEMKTPTWEGNYTYKRSMCPSNFGAGWFTHRITVIEVVTINGAKYPILEDTLTVRDTGANIVSVYWVYESFPDTVNEPMFSVPLIEEFGFSAVHNLYWSSGKTAGITNIKYGKFVP